MKTLILAISLILAVAAAFSASAATMKQVAGSYDILLPAIINTHMTATLEENGHLELEAFSFAYVSCTGVDGKLEKNILVINPRCNGAPVILKIDLSKVTNFNEFTAPVYSSMLGREFDMKFTRR
jgi:hypothetical protein